MFVLHCITILFHSIIQSIDHINISQSRISIWLSQYSSITSWEPFLFCFEYFDNSLSSYPLNLFFDCTFNFHWFYIDKSTIHIFRMDIDRTTSIKSYSQCSFHLIQFNHYESTQFKYICWNSVNNDHVQ